MASYDVAINICQPLRADVCGSLPRELVARGWGLADIARHLIDTVF